MQTTTATKAGNAPDLLSGILSVQVKNEDKITEQDRIYCQNQQDMLYKTLDRIDRWYAIFKEEAEQYREERKFHYEENGKVSISLLQRRFRIGFNRAARFVDQMERDGILSEADGTRPRSVVRR